MHDLAQHVHEQQNSTGVQQVFNSCLTVVRLRLKTKSSATHAYCCAAQGKGQGLNLQMRLNNSAKTILSFSFSPPANSLGSNEIKPDVLIPTKSPASSLSSFKALPRCWRRALVIASTSIGLRPTLVLTVIFHYETLCKRVNFFQIFFMKTWRADKGNAHSKPKR